VRRVAAGCSYMDAGFDPAHPERLPMHDSRLAMQVVEPSILLLGDAYFAPGKPTDPSIKPDSGVIPIHKMVPFQFDGLLHGSGIKLR
jgi:hypothetical protein